MTEYVPANFIGPLSITMYNIFFMSTLPTYVVKSPIRAEFAHYLTARGGSHGMLPSGRPKITRSVEFRKLCELLRVECPHEIALKILVN